MQRALRLASGTALCLAVSFGLALPIPFLAPVLGALLLVSINRPLPFKATLVLALTAMLTTGIGLLLIPLLRYYAFSGVLLIGLGLLMVFRYGLRGGNNLVVTFLVIGLTMIPAAGVADFGLAATVIKALTSGLLLAVLIGSVESLAVPRTGQCPDAAARPGLIGRRRRPGGATCHPDRDADVPAGADRSRQLHAHRPEGRQPGPAEFHHQRPRRRSRADWLDPARRAAGHPVLERADGLSCTCGCSFCGCCCSP